MTSPMKTSLLISLFSFTLLVSPSFAMAQEVVPASANAERADPTSFILNARDVDIHVFADDVSTVTGKTLILDPAVNGKITVISQEPLDGEGVWQLFQAVLRVNGYAAVKSGPAWRIIPQADLRDAGPFSGARRPDTDDLVTRLIRLNNLPSKEAARALKPFLPSFGSVEPFSRPNALIVTGYADDISRIENLAAQLDIFEGDAVDSIRLTYAAAEDLAPMIERLVGTGDIASLRVSADPRSNQILLRGSEQEIGEARNLVASLDVPAGAATQTRVFRLLHSDAETMITVLSGLSGAPATTNPIARQATTSSAGYANSSQSSATLRDNPAVSFGAPQDTNSYATSQSRQSSGNTGYSTDTLSLQAATDINAIVARGAPGEIADIEALISELDVRRPQVMIEAAIVEINGDAAEQFGVQLGLDDAAPDGGAGAVSFSDQGLSLRRILTILGAPASVGILEDGLSLGIGSQNEFGILVQAFGSSAKANLLSTPSLTTLDNHPAEIVVGQNVPFRTGSFATSGNTTNPFTTIQREDVGITLRVLPRIYDGDVIRLEVSQEVSSLVNAAVPGASDLVTNRRSIQTTVLADNGGTVVLGGLITDDRISAESKVPVLGDVPIIGNLFKSRTEAGTQRTLFVFLRPVILRSRAEVDDNAAERYRTLRAAEQDMQSRNSLLIDGRDSKLPQTIEGIY